MEKRKYNGNTRETFQSTLFLNMSFARGSGKSAVTKRNGCGRATSSSNLTSYVIKVYANMVFSSIAAKKRPGLSVYLTVSDFSWQSEMTRSVPRQSTVAKGQILGARRDKLMLYTVAFFMQVGKSEGLKRVGIFIECLIKVHRSGGNDHQSALWYNCTV